MCGQANMHKSNHLRIYNKIAWGTKLILMADPAFPVSCASMGHLLMAQRCPLCLNVCFSPPKAPHPPHTPPTPVESIRDITPIKFWNAKCAHMVGLPKSGHNFVYTNTSWQFRVSHFN